MPKLPPVTDPAQVFTRARMPIETAIVQAAADTVKERYPGVRKVHLVGSRLRRKAGRDLDFVAVVPRGCAFDGKNRTFKVGDLKVNIFFASPIERDATVLEFGLGKDIIRWKRAAKRKGLKLNRFGLWRGSKRVATSMKRIATMLGMRLKPFLVMTVKHPL